MKKFIFLFILIAGMGLFLMPNGSEASSCDGNYAFRNNFDCSDSYYRGSSRNYAFGNNYNYGFGGYRNTNQYNYRGNYDYGFGGYQSRGYRNYAFGGGDRYFWW